MYYPIIDKLKTLMTDIASVKEKEPLVIVGTITSSVGTITSSVGGRWDGDWNDIISAFQNNRPVYFKLHVTTTNTFIVPVISIDTQYADSSILYFNNTMAYGTLFDTNNFSLVPIQ